MIHTLETKTIRSIGNVQIIIEKIADYDGDYSYLGEYCYFKQPSKNQQLVHRYSGKILDSSGLWRNAKGQIQSEPETNSPRMEYDFTFHDNGYDRLLYALQDSRRMDALNNGDWMFIGVKATVTLNGREIGSDSLWGIESDSDESYFAEAERDCIACAVADARLWLSSTCRCRKTA